MSLTRAPIFSSVRPGELSLIPSNNTSDLGGGSLRILKGDDPASNPSVRESTLWYSDGNLWLPLADPPAQKFSHQGSGVTVLDIYVSDEGDDTADLTAAGGGVWSNPDTPFASLEKALQKVREYGYNDNATIHVVGDVPLNSVIHDTVNVVSLDAGFKGFQKNPLVIRGRLTDVGPFAVSNASTSSTTADLFTMVGCNQGPFGGGDSNYLGEKITFQWTDMNTVLQTRSHFMTVNDGPANSFLGAKDFDLEGAVNSGIPVTATLSLRTNKVICHNRTVFKGGRNPVVIRDLNFTATSDISYSSSHPYNTTSLLAFVGVRAIIQNVRIANTSEFTTQLAITIHNSSFSPYVSEDGFNGGLMIDGVESYAVPFNPISEGLFGTELQISMSSLTINELCFRGPVTTTIRTSKIEITNQFSYGQLTTYVDDSKYSLMGGWSYSSYIQSWSPNDASFKNASYFVSFNNSTVIYTSVYLLFMVANTADVFDASIVKAVGSEVFITDVNITDPELVSDNQSFSLRCYDLAFCRGSLGDSTVPVIINGFVESAVTDFIGFKIANSNVSMAIKANDMQLGAASSVSFVKSILSTITFKEAVFQTLFAFGTGGFILDLSNTEYSMTSGTFVVTSVVSGSVGAVINSVGSSGHISTITTASLANMRPFSLWANSSHDGVWLGPSSCDNTAEVISGSTVSGTGGYDNIVSFLTQVGVGNLAVMGWNNFVFDYQHNDSSGGMLVP